MNSNLTGNPTLARKLAQEDAAKIHYSQKPGATITELKHLQTLFVNGDRNGAIAMLQRLITAAESR